MYATSGYFKEIVGTDMSIQGGTINIGPLFVSNDKTAPSAKVTYPDTKRVTEFVNNYIKNDPPLREVITSTIVLYYGGTYGSDKLLSIKFTKEWISRSEYDHTLYYRADFNISNGKTIRVSAENNNSRQTIGKAVVIEGGGSGSTFKLTGIPTYKPVTKGTLWRDPESSALYIVP
jgi:hypothetical protein